MVLINGGLRGWFSFLAAVLFLFTEQKTFDTNARQTSLTYDSRGIFLPLPTLKTTPPPLPMIRSDA
jgi:hypothetical protein